MSDIAKLFWLTLFFACFAHVFGVLLWAIVWSVIGVCYVINRLCTATEHVFNQRRRLMKAWREYDKERRARTIVKARSS